MVQHAAWKAGYPNRTVRRKLRYLFFLVLCLPWFSPLLVSLSYAQFKHSKAAFDLLTPIKKLGDIISADGNLDIAVVPEIDKKAYEINNEIAKKVGIYNKSGAFS